MTISAENNTSYGGTLVNQKYAPLSTIKFNDDGNKNEKDRKLVSAMLSFRHDLFTTAGLLPQPLVMSTPSWTTTIKAERQDKRLPPLIVLSSGRSRWIATGLSGLPEALSDECDLEAIEHGYSVGQSPPIYAPRRLGPTPNRGVYLVVHATEYATYKAAIAALAAKGITGITVVGWEFDRPSPAHPVICGFGASRYAAIELAKHLRGQKAAWDKAWLIDDNVVAVDAFPGFKVMEDELTAAVKANSATMCVGVKGSASVESFTEIVGWAGREKQAQRAYFGVAPKDSEPTGLVQQIACWNIDEFIREHRNFAVAFIAGASDRSLDNFLDGRKIPYRFYDGISVVKEAVTAEDDTPGIRSARQNLVRWVAMSEAGATTDPDKPSTLKPPLPEIRPVSGSKNVKLSDFVIDAVLPDSKKKDTAYQLHVVNNALCQAAEQITCLALAANFPDAPALQKTFQLNGATGRQLIDQRDMP